MQSKTVSGGQEKQAGAPAVLAENVGKVYGGLRLFGRGSNDRAQHALRDVSFALPEGETLGLLGPNGAGKTTLLKIIATLLYPTTGRVLIHGRDISKEPIAVRRDIGLVTSDERSFYWRLTGRQNLRFFAALYRIGTQLAEQRIAELLEVLDLTAAADRPFYGYSSGMKQKLAIARGLLNEPRIVLYDEPTRALDPLSTQQIRGWIRANRPRLPSQTHLLATNLLQEAEQLCDRVIIISQGSAIAFGTIDQIREDWRKHDYAIHRVICADFHANGQLRPNVDLGLLEITWEPAVGNTLSLRVRSRKQSDALNHVLGSILSSGGKILQCDSEETSFDDVFCDLVLGHRRSNPKQPPGSGQ
jgi:ABC-2 type transport system ATP-binding protein